MGEELGAGTQGDAEATTSLYLSQLFAIFEFPRLATAALHVRWSLGIRKSRFIFTEEETEFLGGGGIF